MKKGISSEVLLQLFANLETEWPGISAHRKEQLNMLSQLILEHHAHSPEINLLFVCTHNSRRSQLGEVWMHAVAIYYDLPWLHAFSAGTETTAFNDRMVHALQQAGFPLIKTKTSENSEFSLSLPGSGSSDRALFSKSWSDPSIPKTGLLAIMVCTDAEQNCPFIPGAIARFPLPYEDPKEADDSPEEELAYQLKVREIGLEMLYLGWLIKTAT
ncbi:MAG: protein-tyrosine-phosphatase [Saprospiraceae bacterium]|nr:protein-tyrosine-phosphatase [Saprospiraceae bacterium]